MNNVQSANHLSEESTVKSSLNNVVNFSSVQDNVTNEVENILLGDEITLEDAEKIVSWVLKENTEKEEHMIPVNVEDLMKSKYYYLLKEEGELLGYSQLSEIGDWYFERGTTITSPEHRGQGLWTKLIWGMMEKFSHLKMYSVTNDFVAQKINKKFSTKVPKEELKTELLNAIEEFGELLEDDHIYWNDTFLKNALK